MSTPDPTSTRAERRRAATRRPSVAAGLLAGAVLAGLVAGGGVLVISLAGGDGGSGTPTTELNVAGQAPDDEFVDQIPVSSGSSGVQQPGSSGLDTGGLVIPDTLIPDGFGQGGSLDATGRPVPGSEQPSSPSSPSSPGGLTPSTPPTVPAVPGPVGTNVVCPAYQAPATIKVTTVYPGGRAADTVSTPSGKLRAVRTAIGPCAATTVVMDVVNGVAKGDLAYGAWTLSVDGATPADYWPSIAITSAEAVSTATSTAGTCPTATTSVKVTATTKPLLGLLGVPLAAGTVKATPVAVSAPCQPMESVTATLLLGSATLSLPPGTWTFTAVGHTNYSSSPASLVTTGAGGTKAVTLVVQ